MTSHVSPQAAAAELLRRRRGRASLAGYANAIDIPGKPADDDPDGWLFKPVESGVAAHHLLLLQAVERTAAMRYGRLMVFMPPGSAKSTYCSVVAPSYLMGKQPDRRYILASYGSDLAKRMGRRARQVVKSPGFASLFGCELSGSTHAADEWALTNGSEYLAGGILSGITGNRAHGLFIDDPVKGQQQADSPTIRNSTWDAYQADLLTRLVPGGFVVLVQTRWHEDDLAGRLLPQQYAGQSGMIKCRDGKTWEVINLPAECERADDPLGREVGEMLWKEWFDDEHWAPFRMQSRTWAALFQQRPRPDEGGIFKESWCRNRYGAIPAEAKTIVHSWDTAQKEKDHNDPTAGTVWQQGRGASGHYLREVFVGRIDYPTLRRKVIAYAERDKPIAILIEDKSSGQSLIQDLRNSTSLPVIAIEPDGNKIFRAMEVSPMVEGGLVHLPQAGARLVDHLGRPFDVPWLIDFEGEFFGFPLSTNDDQVDSATQYLRWARTWDGKMISVGSGDKREFGGQGVHDIEDHDGFGSVGRGESTEGF
jgi:predicted phage terminase large subunit-like protein